MPDDLSALERRRQRNATQPAEEQPAKRGAKPGTNAGPLSPEELERRREARREKFRQKQAAAELTKSIQKASTARQHRRPPPLARKGTPKMGALEMLSSFMDLSVSIIHDALHAERDAGKDDQGETIWEPDHKTRRTAAYYVMDKVAAAEGTYIPDGVTLGLEPGSSAIDMGQRVVDLVIEGAMSIEAGQKVFGLLQAHAALQGLNELEELRELVKRLSGDQARVINGGAVPGSDQNPVWMRLKSNAPGA